MQIGVFSNQVNRHLIDNHGNWRHEYDSTITSPLRRSRAVLGSQDYESGLCDMSRVQTSHSAAFIQAVTLQVDEVLKFPIVMTSVKDGPPRVCWCSFNVLVIPGWFRLG